MAKLSSKILIASSLVVAIGFITGVYVFAAYNIEKAKQLHYPIAELGNCGSFDECKTYCNKDENIPTCSRFSIKNGLLTAKEIADTEKLLSLLDQSGLPGKCQGAIECFSYCESIAHTDECLDYAKRHDLIPAEWNADDVRRLAQLHKQGVKFPGNCQGKNECEAYCENPMHIDECLAFAEKTNILPPSELAEAKKFSAFIKTGTTPGGCKSKAECVAYCSDDSRSEECVSFLEKAGFMSSKEAALARKFKGKSPGDCAKGVTSFVEGQKACNAFCNDPANQPTCFKFLEEAGIMTAEEATQAGSMSDFQACVPSAPDEIKQCFIDNLGQEMFDAMSRGVMPFDEDIEGMMAKIRNARKCVNRYADQSLQIVTDNPEALACINSELGKDYLEKAKRGEVKCGNAAESQKKVEICIETAISAKMDRCFSLACSEAATCLKSFNNTEQGGKKKKDIDPGLKAKINDKLSICVAEQINDCLSKDCSEAVVCFQSLQGSGGGQKGEGKLDPALEQKINAKMGGCFKQPQGGQQPSQGAPALQQPPQGVQPPGGQIPQEYCSSFASAPSCSYVGSPDSQNYKYCKQCYPDK